jgi:hypothetical protein
MRGWRILLLTLAERPSALRMTTHQHLDALRRLPRPSRVLTYNAAAGAPAWLRHLKFDAVVLHTTFLCARWYDRFPELRRSVEWLAGLDVPKIAFPQDDYALAHVLDDWLDELGVTAVCTPLVGHEGELYPVLSRKAAFHHALTGYIDQSSAERFAGLTPAGAERRLDIAYRARKLPYWCGSHGQLKHRVGEAVLAAAPAHGLRCDISTRPQETILGQAWLDFMASARATIGAESGSSVLDAHGEIRARVDELTSEDPAIGFEEVAQQMPAGWDDYRFFALSPRHLEAVVTKTAQILVEGAYSGVLEPERHYLPLRRDFSDLDEVLERAKDQELLARIARQAHEEVYASARFGLVRLTRLLQDVLAEQATPGEPRRLTAPSFEAVARAATAQGAVARFRVPMRHVLTLRRGEYVEALAALRLIATDSAAARLVLDYLLASDVREQVSPRQALRDFLLLGSLRSGRNGKQGPGRFRIETHVDEERRRIVLKSVPSGEGDGGEALEPGRLDALLRGSSWEFAWDHSAVGDSAPVPLAGSRYLRLPLPKHAAAPLPTLSFLARRRPSHLAAAVWFPHPGRRG